MRKALGCAALALAFWSSPSVAGREDGSLRVATWNTYLLSNVFRCLPRLYDVPAAVDCLTKSTSLSGALSTDQTIARTDAIADAILSLGDKVDVIALNEVWDETAKKRLVQRLSPTFPNYVSRVDAGHVVSVPAAMRALGISRAALPDWEGEDSGLMIFARAGVKFLDMGAKTPVPPGGIAGTIPFVRAQTYTEGSGVDALAAKGMAAVHVEQRIGGRQARAYIVFTHTQADTAGEAARDAQLKQMRAFILHNVLDHARPVADEMRRVLVMGDLNFQGLNARLPVPPGATFDPEWTKRFVQPFPGQVGDSWARENSADYVGPTYPRDTIQNSDRLDYLLSMRADATIGFCVQHAQVLLPDAPSDHNALVSDLNGQHAYCNPRGAALPKLGVPFSEALGSNPDVVTIAAPGAMRWFRLTGDSAATVDVFIAGAGVDGAMYLPSDLSHPIDPIETVPGRRTTWVAPKDFFIRTAGRNRSFVGNYGITFQRRACSSPTDPCFLRPTEGQQAIFKANDLLGLEDAAWFRADVKEAADNGVAQQVSVTVGAPNGYDVSLRDAASPQTVIPADKFFLAGRGWVLTLPVAGTRNMLIRVARDAIKATRRTVTATWTTNLQVVQVTSVECQEETSGFLGSKAGEDEISLRLTMDGKNQAVPATSYRSFDCDSWSDQDPGFSTTLRGFGPVTSELTEWDDGSPNDESGQKQIDILPAPLLTTDRRRLDYEFEGGRYSVHYVQRRGSSGLPPQ